MACDSGREVYFTPVTMTMPADPPAYRFARATGADAPMLEQWLALPHLAPHHGAAADMVQVLLNPSLVRGYIIWAGDEAIGFAGTRRPERGAASLSTAVDFFVGAEAYRAPVAGAEILAAFTDRLKHGGAAEIVMFPKAEDTTAIEICRRAGFREGEAWKGALIMTLGEKI
ncbi:MAG: GNAT family N-acetyltransferase [Pseudomonadota bacterium]